MPNDKKGSGGGNAPNPPKYEKSHGSQMPTREIRNNNGEQKSPKSDRPTNSGGPRERG